MMNEPTPSRPTLKLRWLLWYSLAHVAEGAIAIRAQLTAGTPRWPAMLGIGVAAYFTGLALGLLIRARII